jgi:predicted nucleic acid-binding protein
MTRYIVDAVVAIELAKRQIEVGEADRLLAPTLLRSQILSILHAAVARGEMPDREARTILERVGKLPIRLLGDAVLRRRAWDIATRCGWEGTFDAEYVALTLLQGDVLVTEDPGLARAVEGTVATTTMDAVGWGVV